MVTFTGIILAAHFRDFIVLGIGLLADFSVMFLWWRDVIHESRVPGLHKIVTQVGLRYGMALFISSEVMFFVSFFWNYFNYFFYPDKMGTEAASSSAQNIKPSSRSFTGLRSGSIQFVAQLVYTQPHHMAAKSVNACNAPSADICARRNSEICVTAKTKIRSKKSSICVTCARSSRRRKRLNGAPRIRLGSAP